MENPFANDEAPTLALSKPALFLLVRETAPAPQAEPVPPSAAEPASNAAPITLPSRAESANASAATPPVPSSSHRSVLLVCAFVLSAAALGALFWSNVHPAGARATSSEVLTH